MEMIKQHKAIVGIVVAVFAAAVLYFVFADGSSKTSEADTTPTEQNLPVNEATDNDDVTDDTPVDEVDETTPEPIVKQPTPVANVLEKPVVFTGFGNSVDSPLALSQNTSTTCTTDAKVECVLVFTNQDTRVVVEFDAMTTDNTGVARWEWTGSDVGSGTWDVEGTAGDKTSDIGVLYIQ